MVIQKAQVEYLLLTILDSRLRGNDTFFQSIPSLPVIPAKAGIQELIDNLGIVDKQIIFFKNAIVIAKCIQSRLSGHEEILSFLTFLQSFTQNQFYIHLEMIVFVDIQVNTKANWIGLDSLIRIKSRIENPRHQEDARMLREIRKRPDRSTKR